jgi:hypothetical protein
MLPFFNTDFTIEHIMVLDEDIGVDLSEGGVGVIRLHTCINIALLWMISVKCMEVKTIDSCLLGTRLHKVWLHGIAGHIHCP